MTHRFKFGYRRFKKRVRKLKHRILRTPNTTIGVHKGFSEIKKRRKNG